MFITLDRNIIIRVLYQQTTIDSLTAAR